jgi:hypothetical protein
MISLLAATLVLCFSMLATAPAPPNAMPYGLPAGAVVIELQAVPGRWGAHRAIVVWLLKPKKYPLGYCPEEYTCPDETRGSYYRGPTRVSLIDTLRNKIINTVSIKEEPEKDAFDIPYKIRGSYYEVKGVAKGAEGKPTIIALKDYNGDGKALEFALFDAEACMGLQTTLIGYSTGQDRVIQYPIVLSVNEGPIESRRRTREVSYWIDYLFSKTPQTPGQWKYEIDYRGRGGTLDQYTVRYNARLERFEATRVSTP